MAGLFEHKADNVPHAR